MVKLLQKVCLFHVICLVIILSIFISILKFKACLKPIRLFFKRMSKVGVYEPSQEQDSMKTLPLSDNAGAEAEPEESKKRVPKRILHFSDGTLEEYSSDEGESDVCKPRHETQLMQSNLNSAPWMPWFWYHTVYVGTKALAVCDYLGESLANFFGIISPKYEYEIEQYKKMIAEEEERRKQDIELGGWEENALASSSPVQTEPQSTLSLI